MGVRAWEGSWVLKLFFPPPVFGGLGKWLIFFGLGKWLLYAVLGDWFLGRKAFFTLLLIYFWSFPLCRDLVDLSIFSNVSFFLWISLGGLSNYTDCFFLCSIGILSVVPTFVLEVCLIRGKVVSVIRGLSSYRFRVICGILYYSWTIGAARLYIKFLPFLAPIGEWWTTLFANLWGEVFTGDRFGLLIIKLVFFISIPSIDCFSLGKPTYSKSWKVNYSLSSMFLCKCLCSLNLS
jgi:hypothetical protein